MIIIIILIIIVEDWAHCEPWYSDLGSTSVRCICSVCTVVARRAAKPLNKSPRDSSSIIFKKKKGNKNYDESSFFLGGGWSVICRV